MVQIRTPTNSNVGSYSIKLGVTDGVDTVYQSFSFRVNNVNDAPTSRDTTIQSKEDMELDILPSFFPYADVDVGDSLELVQITSLPAKGYLVLKSVNDTLTTIPRNLNRSQIVDLKYYPLDNEFGVGYADFKFKVMDQQLFSAEQTLSIDLSDEPEDQTITFPAMASRSYSDTIFQLKASASSGNDVVYTSNTPSVCCIVGADSLMLLASGTCTIAADQPGKLGAYVAAPQVTKSFTVNKGRLTLSATAQNKVYDGSAVAALTDVKLLGVVRTDDIQYTMDAVEFDSKNVGTGRTVTVSILNATGADTSKYNDIEVVPLSANITAKPVVISQSGLSADKTYDGLSTVSIQGSVNLSGLIPADMVTVSGSLVGTFADANAADGKYAKISGLSLSGANASNYSIVLDSILANIEPKTLTISGVTALDKIYDAGTQAQVRGGSLVGVVGGDQVQFTLGTGYFDSKEVAKNKAVQVVGSVIGGVSASNYRLSEVSPLTTSIKAYPLYLDLSAASIEPKTYNGDKSAVVQGVIDIQGVKPGDDIKLGGFAYAEFADKNVGTGKKAAIKGLYLMGADALQYEIVPDTLKGNIVAKELTITGLLADNKVYDRTVKATLSGAKLAGVLSMDTVSLSLGQGEFETYHVGTGILVNASGSKITGAQAGNYLLREANSVSANITPATLQLGGLVVQNEVYDGTIQASFSGTATITGVIGVDTNDVKLWVNEPGAQFYTKTVGTKKAIKYTGFGLLGPSKGDYILNTALGQFADITPKNLTISGVSVKNKVYDGTTVATATQGELVGAYGFDDVYLIQGAAAFNNKNVGQDKLVKFTGSKLSGLDAANYTLSEVANSNANITPKSITISGVTAPDKTYDGMNVVPLSGGSLDGVVAGDTVTLVKGVATTANSKVGSGLDVTVSGTTLSGAYAANYSVVEITGLSTSVNKKKVTISAIKALDRTFDGTTNVTLVGGDLVGVVSSDDLHIIKGTGAYADANVGLNKPITVTGYALTGADAESYSLDQPVITGNIIKNAPTLALKLGSKVLLEDFTTQKYGLAKHFSDPDNMVLAYTIHRSSAKAITSSVITDSVVLQSKLDQYGRDTVIVRATDLIGQYVQDTMIVVTQPRNDIPVIKSALSDQTLSQNFGSLNIEWKSRLTDADGDVLAAFATTSNKGIVKAMVVGSNIFLSSVKDSSGVDTVFVRYTDGSAYVRDTFLVNVNFSKLDLGTVAILSPRNNAKLVDLDPTLSWKKANVDQYLVEIYQGSTLVKSVKVSDTAYDLQGLKPDLSYKFVLTASNRDGFAKDSVEFSTIPSIPGTIDLSNLDQVISFKNTVAEIDLSSRKGNADSLRIRVYVKGDPSLQVLDTIVPATAAKASADMMGLTDKSDWTLEVEAINYSGSASNSADFKYKGTVTSIVQGNSSKLSGVVTVQWRTLKGELLRTQSAQVRSGRLIGLNTEGLYGHTLMVIFDQNNQKEVHRLYIK